MLTIGCHLSNAGGFKHMYEDTVYIGGNTFQFFTRNPRGGQAKPIDKADISYFLNLSKDFGRILAHAPYTFNPCSDKESIRVFTVDTMKDDISRMEYLPGNLYNFHPGSHVGQGIEKGIEYIAELLNNIIYDGMTTTVLLETMAGKGSEIGSRFEELREIIDRVTLKEHVGVCLDTVHVYDAGYDIVNDLSGVLSRFDSIIGLNRLMAIHLNDSKNPFESHKDRHEKIGEGYIGKEALARVINHPALKHLPFFLETPNELDGYKSEIGMLRSLYKE